MIRKILTGNRQSKKEWYIKTPHFYCLEYNEGEKKLIVDLDMRDRVHYLHPRLIGHWEKPYEDVEITVEDKGRILQNIRQFFLLEGADPGNIIVENSKVYETFVKLSDSYNPEKESWHRTGSLDKIPDSEIEKVEDLIWETFHEEHDTGLLRYFPKLKKYDGISVLKKLVNNYQIPSAFSMSIAYMLYESTKETYYLKLMEKNIVMSRYDVYYIADMIHLEPCEDVYHTLVRLYMNCPERDETALTHCVDGILYNKGFINDLEDCHQFIAMREVSSILRKAPRAERGMMIERLEKGEFDQYKGLTLRDIMRNNGKQSRY